MISISLYINLILKKVMLRSNSELLRSARESLTGRWGIAIGTFLVYEIIISSLQSGGYRYQSDADSHQGFTFIYSFMSLIYLVVAGPFALGIAIFSLNLARNVEARFEQIFDGFRNFKTAFIAYILKVLFIVLWTLLFIIPGIIAALSYAMTFFIIADDDSIEPMAALDKSKKMMYGYKSQLFYLSLRFFGLALLCILTLGIGFLWLIPYVYVTTAKFYDDIKDNPKG